MEDKFNTKQAFEAFFDRIIAMGEENEVDLKKLKAAKAEVIADFIYISESWRAIYTKRIAEFIRKHKKGDAKMSPEEFAAYHSFIGVWLSGMHMNLTEHNNNVVTAHMCEGMPLAPHIITQGGGNA